MNQANEESGALKMKYKNIPDFSKAKNRMPDTQQNLDGKNDMREKKSNLCSELTRVHISAYFFVIISKINNKMK